MKKVYIAHPLLGPIDKNDRESHLPFHNRQDVNQICLNLHLNRDDILILSPIHAFSFISTYNRVDVFRYCRELMNFADELWVFGEWEASEGCKLEIEWAKERGIPVVFMKEGDIHGN